MAHSTASQQLELEADHRPPTSFPLSIPPQPQNRVLHDTGIPYVTGTGQFQFQWEDVPPTIGNSAEQATLWNPHHSNVVNYGTADNPELANDLARPYTHPNVGPAHQQGIPEDRDMQIMFHGNPRNDYFGRATEDVVPGPNEAAFYNSSPHRVPDVGQPAEENLRRLASRYIHHPDSQVDMVRMEPGSAGRYKVVIILEMADFL